MTPLEDFRARKDAFFRDDHDSPLHRDQRRHFRGLAYYPEDPSLSLVAQVQRLQSTETVRMNTSTGGTATYRRWGRFTFTVAGHEATLTIYQDVDGGSLFLPFADATSGSETYGSGRYLEPEEHPDGSAVIDFNYAYNPYCAYNADWSCPIPPAENRVAVPIRAGEMVFPDAAHEALA